MDIRNIRYEVRTLDPLLELLLDRHVSDVWQCWWTILGGGVGRQLLQVLYNIALTSIIACTSLLELNPRWRPPGLHCSGTRVLNLGSVPHIRHLCTLAVFAENIFECQEIFLILSWIIALCLVESNWIIHVSNVWHVGKESAIHCHTQKILQQRPSLSHLIPWKSIVKDKALASLIIIVLSLPNILKHRLHVC